MVRYQKVFFLILLGFLLCNTTSAQKIASQKQKKVADPVLATIGKEKLTLSEFERLYAKSANAQPRRKNDSTLVNDRRQFLDMVVKYRLKLAEAYRQQFDIDPEINNELSQYRKNIATSYYLDHQLIEPNAKMLYERKKVEIHAGHIFIAKKKNSTPEDTLKAYQKALHVLEQAHAGVSFDSLAMKYSEDPTSKFKGGDLGLFSTGIMLASIEDECFRLNDGEISKNLVRTSYGYHIIKVFGRTPAVNERQTSHILIRLSPKDTPQDTLKKYQRIMALRDSVIRGADFGFLAQQNSEDPRTAGMYGDMGFLSRQQTIPLFDEFIFSSKIGNLSPVLRSRAGYHIVKIMRDRPLGSYDELREELRNTYKLTRYTADLHQLINRINKDINAEIDETTLAVFLQRLDTSKTTTSGNWDSLLTSTDRSLILYRYADRQIELDSLISFLKSGTEFKDVALKPISMRTAANRLLEIYTLDYTTRNLENESSEFAGIMKEYREGLMIYKLDQENVWQKVVIDDSALQAYYKGHTSEYRFGDRVDFSEVTVSSDSLAKVLLDSIKAGVEFDSIVVRNTIRPGMKKQLGRWGMTETKMSVLAQKAFAMEVGAVSQQPVKDQFGFAIIKVHAKNPAREKTFEEASSEVTAQYQEFMTKKIDAAWVEALKKKTQVKVYEKVFTEKYSKK